MGNIITAITLSFTFLTDMAVSTAVYYIITTYVRNFIKAAAKHIILVQPNYYSCSTTPSGCPETISEEWCDDIGNAIIIVLCTLRGYVWGRKCLGMFFRWLNPLRATESLEVGNWQHQHQNQHQHQRQIQY